jgi:dihydrofolate reductase
LQTLQTNATLINGDIEKRVFEIRNEEGKDIWLFGGASLTTSLLNAGMVDEFLLAIHPVILGSGKALFNGVDKRNWLKLTECKTFDNGLMQNRYSIAR